MEKIVQFLLFASSTLIFFSISTRSANSCKPDSCGATIGPDIRFPFRLRTRKPVRCGFPGFDLYCNGEKQTTLKLPNAGEFAVNAINYSAQTLSLDPGPCLPGRIQNFEPSDSPFRFAHASNYALLNCSAGSVKIMADAPSFSYDPIRCLSTRNYTVLATNLHPSENVPVPPMCRLIGNVSVPVNRTGSVGHRQPMGLLKGIELTWSDPACSHCENQGLVCGFKAGSGLEIGCNGRARRSTGFSRSAEYGLIIGVGIPGIVCIVGLFSYTGSLIRVFCLRRRLSPEFRTVSIPDQRSITGGLDKLTIESYPKTVVGQSCRLPEPSDGACPICLSEYQPRDTLRSIPDCNHHFHVDCIDEWLKLNGTCPLCRNSPDGSTIRSSTLSLSSSTFSESLSISTNH